MSEPKKSFKKFARYFLFSSFAILFIIILIVILSPAPKKSVIPETREGKISHLVEKAGGKKVSVRLDTNLIDQGGYLVDIEYYSEGGKVLLFSKAMDIMKAIWTDSTLGDIQVCKLRPQTAFIDNYGKETVSQAANMCMHREVAKKVVWENITYEMFINLLKNEEQLLWIHPAIH